MKKATKIWLIAAASLVLLGCILFVGAMTALGWDFSRTSTVDYETNITGVSETFSDISVTTDTADIVFAPSGDGKCRVECYEDKNAKHSVSVENGTLTVSIDDRRSWHDYIGFGFVPQKITVYLPETEYGALSVHGSTGNIEIPKEFSFTGVDISLRTGNADLSASVIGALKIETSTGNINAVGISAESLDFSTATGIITVSGVTCGGDVTVGVSTGEAELTDVSCRNVISTGTTGDISLNSVIASEKISVERSTGQVKFGGCDAGELYVKTSTGDVTGSLLTGKVFVTDTRTGSVDVPGTASGGRCEIRTVTGDIRIRVG